MNFMDARIVAAAVLLILAAAFFFPKDAGNTDGFGPPPPAISRTEYGCMGFKQTYQPTDCMDCGAAILCYGIVTSEKKCYTYIRGRGLVEVPNCKNPSTWQEILGICPDCLYEAANSAYSYNNLPKSVGLCSSITGSGKNDCILGIARAAMYKGGLNDAENICNDLVIVSKDACLRELADKLAEKDVESGVRVCGSIDPGREKDNCFHNMAVKAREENVTRALEICGMIYEDKTVPPCIELIERYCEIYNCL